MTLLQELLDEIVYLNPFQSGLFKSKFGTEMLLITLMDDPGERWGSLALLVQGLWVALDSLDYGILLKDLERGLEITLAQIQSLILNTSFQILKIILGDLAFKKNNAYRKAWEKPITGILNMYSSYIYCHL